MKILISLVLALFVSAASAGYEVQKQLTEQLDVNCETNLEYFRQQVEENPEDTYFQFMLEKWEERCKEQ